MKKIIALLLVFVMSFMSFPFAYATDTDTSHEMIRLVSQGHGEFKVINDGSSAQTFNSKDAGKGDIILASTTDDEEILATSDGNYLIHVYDDSYLETSKIDISDSNLTSKEPLLRYCGIEEDSISSIEDIIATQKSIGNDDFHIEIYVPLSLDESEISLHSSTLAPTIEYKNFPYTTPGGITYQMTDCFYKYVNISAPEPAVYTGANTKSFMETVVDGVAIVAGLAEWKIGIVGSYKSAYDVYCKYKGYTTSTGYVGDYVNASIVYDLLVRKTSFLNRYSNEYVVGKISYKAWLNKCDYTYYFQSKGIRETVTASINSIIKTKYFDDNETATQPYGKEAGPKFKVFDNKHTFILVPSNIVV